MSDLPGMQAMVYRGCRIHERNVRNCIGCVEDSLANLVTGLDALVTVIEERHRTLVAQQAANLEALKAIRGALGELRPGG